MESLIVLLLCVPIGLVIYFLIVRPFLVPLCQRIPTGRAYRPTFGSKI